MWRVATQWRCSSPFLQLRCWYTNKFNNIGEVAIGGIKLPLQHPTNPGFVPLVTEGPAAPLLRPQSLLHFLKWMFEKESINQDMLLIGPPGPLRRLLALYFCELTHREAEVVVLTRDTTEADLKQRREISGKKSEYQDQAVVRAAIHGRVLIFEGLERAERNIMPLINNLLENREMSLDDGRFLVSPMRYQQMLESGQNSIESLQRLGLVPVHPRFRVIGLTIPVPRYPGLPLDPPLRSRFQGKVIPHMPTDTLYEVLTMDGTISPDLAKRASQLVGALTFIGDSGSLDDTKQPQPIEISPLSLLSFCRFLERYPHSDPAELFSRLYPSALLHSSDPARQRVIQEGLKKYGFEKREGKKATPNSTNEDGAQGFGLTPTHEVQTLIRQMQQDYHVGRRDMCIVGPRGSGKSVIAQQFCNLIGQRAELFPLHRDLLHRDLLQRRTTDIHGNTIWEPSPLVFSALHGCVCILDNIDSLPVGMLAAIRPLIEERMITLFDGTRLIPQTSFDRLCEFYNVNSKVLNQNGTYAIHPSFSVIAIGTLHGEKGVRSVREQKGERGVEKGSREKIEGELGGGRKRSERGGDDV
jgi:von Willebrand factor A domain-containing protein 8